MKKVLTLLSCVAALCFTSLSVSAQTSCTATIIASDSINPNGIDTYYFTAVGSFNASAYFIWSFGDGTGASGQTVTHQYPGGANMLYRVTVTISDSVLGCTFIAADTAYPRGTTSPCSGSVSFTNVDSLFTLSTTNNGFPPYSYLWNMPNGTTSTLPDPTFFVPDSSNYPGSVIVTDSIGCADTLLFDLNLYYAVNNNQPCQAYFYVVPDSVSGGYTAVDCSAGSGLMYEWSFGDGDSSSQQYPTHVYAAPGYYTVCLTVSTALCTSTFCDSAFYAHKAGGPMSSLTVISRSAATGITNVKADAGISIYPNPATYTLAIHVSGNDKIERSIIYNTNGQRVGIFGSSALISVSQLPTGLYLIDVKTSNGSFRTNFIKQN